MAIIQNLFIYRSKVEPENKSFIWARTVQVREKIEIELLIWDVDHWITLGDSSIIEEFRSYPWDTLTPDVPTPIEDGTDIFTAITSLHSLVKENTKNILTLENKQISIDADIVMLNSRVDDVGNAILDVKDDITTINNDLSVIGTDITNVNNRVNDTNTRIDNTNVRIDETNNDIQDLDDKVVGLYDSVKGDITQLSNTKLDKAPNGNIQLIRDDNGLIDDTYLPASQIPVTGIKGDSETNYRTGNVSLNINEIVGQDLGDELIHLGADLVNNYASDGVLEVSSGQWQVVDSVYALKSDLRREFTYIVDSQASFNSWVNRQSGIDLTRILIKAGTYTLNSEIDLGYSQYVKAMPGAIINYNVSTTSYGAFYMTYGTSSRVDNIGRLYEGLVVNLSDAYNQTAFRGCSNLKNCGALIRGTASAAIHSINGFYNCINLYECYLFAPIDSQYLHINGFYNCSNLNNCIISNWVDKTGLRLYSFFGYYNCKYLNNCTCIFNGFFSSQEDGSCFYNCYDLIGCLAEVPTSQDVEAISLFMMCTRLSRCSANWFSVSGSWGYYQCKSMQNNSTTNGSGYAGCYADGGTVYPVADTPNGGFNSRS